MIPPKLKYQIKGIPFPPEYKVAMEQEGIFGLVFKDGIQVSAITSEKTVARTKLVAKFACSGMIESPWYRSVIVDPCTGDARQKTAGERQPSSIAAWAKNSFTPEPTQEQIEGLRRICPIVSEEDMIKFIIDPFNLIYFEEYDEKDTR